MQSLLNEALDYAKRGWYVVPDHSVTPDGLCTCGDRECKVQGKHPRMERDSVEGKSRGTGTINEVKIKEWWNKWPDSNIAIVCGFHSGLVAIDIDPRNDGFKSWQNLMRLYGDCSDTLSVTTGGGGVHLLFKHPKGPQPVRNRNGLFPGIDVKADAGRIVAPPSRHKSGNTYRWNDIDKAPKTLPLWLLQMIQFQKGTGSWQAMKKAGRR